jgi:hypothetical protein
VRPSFVKKFRRSFTAALFILLTDAFGGANDEPRSVSPVRRRSRSRDRSSPIAAPSSDLTHEEEERQRFGAYSPRAAPSTFQEPPESPPTNMLRRASYTCLAAPSTFGGAEQRDSDADSTSTEIAEPLPQVPKTRERRASFTLLPAPSAFEGQPPPLPMAAPIAALATPPTFDSYAPVQTAHAPTVAPRNMLTAAPTFSAAPQQMFQPRAALPRSMVAAPASLDSYSPTSPSYNPSNGSGGALTAYSPTSPSYSPTSPTYAPIAAPQNFASNDFVASASGGGAIADPTLVRTSSAAKSDEARVFQHASRFAHHVYLASNVHVPVLSSDALLQGDASSESRTTADGERSATQATPSTTTTKPSDAELQSRDDEALAIRLSLAAHTLVAWSKSQPLAGARSTNVRNDAAQRSMEALHLDEARTSDSYVAGSAAALLAKGATLTDEAGDRVLAADNDSLYILSADDDSACACATFFFFFFFFFVLFSPHNPSLVCSHDFSYSLCSRRCE